MIDTETIRAAHVAEQREARELTEQIHRIEVNTGLTLAISGIDLLFSKGEADRLLELGKLIVMRVGQIQGDSCQEIN